ncbi:MAG TPA: M36 family metallopeptidase [Pyrinomonadaceae bacterium]|nr:M36 family metallopeptidase [Pyrinomonadaceae bacterium]
MATKGSKSKKTGRAAKAAKRGTAKPSATKGTKKSGKQARRPSTKAAAKPAAGARGAQALPEDEGPRRGASVSPPIPANFHALYDRGFRASRGIVPESVTPAETEGHRQLDKEVEGLGIHYDHSTQLPKLVTVTPKGTGRAGALSRGASAEGGTPEGAVTQFLEQRGDLWNLTPEDTATIEVVSVSQPRSVAASDSSKRSGRGSSRSASGGSDFNIGNLKTVNLVQRVEGKEVFNSDVTAAVNADNEVVSMAGQFFPGAGAESARSKAASRGAGAGLTPEEEAIARAVFDLTGVVYEARDFAAAPAPPESGPYRFYDFKAAEGDTRPALERPVRLKDVMFPLGSGEFVPGYYMELWVKGFPAFSYVMDAVDTPDVLYRKNLTSQVAFKYRVHNTGDGLFRPHDGPAPGTPHPTGKPDGFQAKIIKERVVQLESLLPGDPWLPADATTTEGNNCIAYADLTKANSPAPGNPFGRVTSPRTFNQAYDHSKSASDPKNLQNSLVGMFFHVNWLHDRWYEAGFDEASGNAQKSNFGRGGIGGDPILAEGNDARGTDNAFMATPADGASPRMEMFEFVRPSPLPSRTSNHEALITFHEMGHYITNRLIGNGNGLFNLQGGGMGEGWGDFFAICMTSQRTDDFAKGAFAVGGWTDITSSFKENYYFSIRRYPYSADMKKNPLTFKHIGSNVVLPTGAPLSPLTNRDNTEEHNVGEVWCTALWEVFVNLITKLGHAEAERRMLAYVIGGLKLTPPSPTFIQARDGIISAVSTMAPGDLPQVRAGFAKRGMGRGAVAPPSSSTTLSGVVESFTA